MYDAAVEIEELYSFNIFDLGIELHANHRDTRYNHYQVVKEKIEEVHHFKDLSTLHSKTLNWFISKIGL